MSRAVQRRLVKSATSHLVPHLHQRLPTMLQTMFRSRGKLVSQILMHRHCRAAASPLRWIHVQSTPLHLHPLFQRRFLNLPLTRKLVKELRMEIFITATKLVQTVSSLQKLGSMTHLQFALRTSAVFHNASNKFWN